MQTGPVSNAEGMPSRAKQRRAEQSRDEPSKAETSKEGYLQPQTPRPPDGRDGPTRGPTLSAAQHRSWLDFERTEWQPFREAWIGRGLLFAPGGSPDDDDDTQRGLLWSIASNRPNDLGRWVREAKGTTPREVVTHVLERWHDIRDAVTVDDPEWEAVKAAEGQAAGRSMARIGDVLGTIEPGRHA